MLNVNQFNSSRVLQAIWESGSISRVAIADKLELNKSTITKLISPLLDDGIVVSYEKYASGNKGGRKAEVLSINDKYGFVLGVEIQTDISNICVTDLNGRIILSDNFSNNPVCHHFNELIKDVLDRAVMLCTRRNLKVLGAVVSVSGLINPYQGIVYSSNPLKVETPVTVYDKLSDYGFPIIIENDANCCCSREIVMNKSDRKRNFLCVLGEFRKSKIESEEKGGIAIGLGIVIKGSILHGDNFSAGEFQSLGKSQENPSQFNVSPEEAEIITTNEIILRNVLRELANNISLLVNTMNITQLYIEGDLVKTEMIFRPILRDEIQRNWSYDSQADCQIHFSDGGKEVVAHGAACYLIEKLFSPHRFWESNEEYYPSGIEFLEILKEYKNNG